jgi:hypothetical protein
MDREPGFAAFHRAAHPKTGDAASQETSPETREFARGTKETLKRRPCRRRNIRKFWRDNGSFLAGLPFRLRSGAWLIPRCLRNHALMMLGISPASLAAMSEHMIDRKLRTCRDGMRTLSARIEFYEKRRPPRFFTALLATCRAGPECGQAHARYRSLTQLRTNPGDHDLPAMTGIFSRRFA